MLKKEKIKEVLELSRIKKGITKKHLANKLGVTKATMTHYFLKTPSSLIHAIILLNELDVDVKDFYENERSN